MRAKIQNVKELNFFYFTLRNTNSRINRFQIIFPFYYAYLVNDGRESLKELTGLLFLLEFDEDDLKVFLLREPKVGLDCS